MAVTWMEVLEGVVNWLSVYVYRIVPLLSLSMHLILSVFSESRRREDQGWKRLLVWVAYQLTDWGPAYVIANQYLETSPRQKMIIAFWVPFLLLHHARPDNMSAYTIEDSELWKRLMLSVLPQALGSIIVVYRFILNDCAADWSLRWASGIMLFLGIWKYLESAAAIWLSNLAHIRDPKWLSEKQIDLSSLEKLSKKHPDLWERNDDESLLVAHDLLEICKGAFCDYTVGVDHKAITTMLCAKWEIMCTVAEMELSLMYDILYTKAAMVHTWGGYAIRLASPPLTAAALLLFALHCKEGMTPTDQAISYTLLLTTFLFDVRWLLRALASTWTHSYLKGSMLKHEFLCQGTWKKIRAFVVSLRLSRLSLWLWARQWDKEPKSYRRWAGTFGQCNLLDQCAAGNRHDLHSIPTRPATESGRPFRSRGLPSEDHSRGREIPDYLKKLVFGSICEKLFPPPAGTTNTEQTTNNDTPGPPDPPSGPTDSPKGSKGSVSPRSLGSSPSPGKSSTGPTEPDGPGAIVPHPILSTGFNQPSGAITQWPTDREVPDHSTYVHPASPDPDDRYLGSSYPRERICNGVHHEPHRCPHYPRPRGWMCTGVGVQAAPCPQCPRQQICIGINNELPRLTYPCCQVPAGTRNAPFEEGNGYNVLAMPYGHPEEQAAAGGQWWYGYYYEQTEWMQHGLNRCAYRGDTPNTHVVQVQDDDDQAKADTGEQHGGRTKHVKPDQDIGFPPELQEVILIWHVATDVFLACRTGELPTGDSIKLEKAIVQMSDYMMFLVAERSEMLPGLKLSSRYRNTQVVLKKIRDIKAASEGPKHYTSYVTNEKEELARWMPKNMDRLEGPGTITTTTIVWEGTQLARVLLRLVPQDVQPGWSISPKEVTVMEKKLECWTPDLKDRASGSMKRMLEFILDSWVRLLMYASMRCSRDSHAKQLSRGGELTTLVWIISEHAENGSVREQLPLLFPPKEKMA